VIYFCIIGIDIHVFHCTHAEFLDLHSEAYPHIPCHRNTYSLYVNLETQILIDSAWRFITVDRGILFEYSLVAICDKVMAMKWQENIHRAFSKI